MADYNELAANIKKFRRRRELTQAELAKQLFVTPQNISKWERGLSVPSVNSLVALARELGVSCDELLGQYGSQRQKTAIAIDGGGTKTEFVLFSFEGEILRRLILSGSNPNSCGMSASLSVLKSGIDELFAEAGEPRAIYAGIAGCGAKENRRKMLSFIKKNYGGVSAEVETDVLNVINCSPENERMIALICGTGSAVYAKTPDGLHRVGGWGYIFDCGGSGFDLGRDAIRASLAERDGIGEKTLITELTENKLGGTAWSKISELYSLGRDYIASFSGVVFEAYRAGDVVARRIIDKNIGRLAELVTGSARLYDCGRKIFVSGGLCAHGDVLLPVLNEKTGDKFDILFNTMPQMYGAAVGAKALLGEKADEEFTKRFMESYKNAEN